MKKEQDDAEAYDRLPVMAELDTASTGIGGSLLKPANHDMRTLNLVKGGTIQAPSAMGWRGGEDITDNQVSSESSSHKETPPEYSARRQPTHLTPTHDHTTLPCYFLKVVGFAYRNPPALPHQSRLLPGARLPQPKLSMQDAQSRRPRLNRGMNIGDLGLVSCTWLGTSAAQPSRRLPLKESHTAHADTHTRTHARTPAAVARIKPRCYRNHR